MISKYKYFSWINWNIHWILVEINSKSLNILTENHIFLPERMEISHFRSILLLRVIFTECRMLTTASHQGIIIFRLEYFQNTNYFWAKKRLTKIATIDCLRSCYLFDFKRLFSYFTIFSSLNISVCFSKVTTIMAFEPISFKPILTPTPTQFLIMTFEPTSIYIYNMFTHIWQLWAECGKNRIYFNYIKLCSIFHFIYRVTPS